MILLSVVLAQALPELPSWAAYGIPGLVLLAIITRQLAPGWAVKDAREDREKAVADRDIAIAELSALRQKMEDAIIPALTRATDAVTDLLKETRAGG